LGRDDIARGLLRWGLTFVVLVLAGWVIFVGGKHLLGGGGGQEVDAGALQTSSLERMLIGMYLNVRKGDIESAASDDDTPVVFTINPGETAATIAPRLQREGLITDSQLFLWLVRYEGVDALLEAGEYELRANMTMNELIDSLQHGRLREVSVTIPEGKRAEEVAALLEERGIVESSTFLDLVRSSAPAYDFLQDRPADAPTSMEGFLFPETYLIPEDYDAQQVLDLLVMTFAESFTAEMRQAAAEADMSVYEVVTLASIVEREAVVAEERSIIASVYLNRLEQGMYLQSDPTVQYALGYQEDSGQWWKIPMSLEEDVVVDSPYNTYMYPGLPPGPICSPGLASMQAVLEPADTPYLFFFSKFDGSHAFAETYEEHLQNQELYQGQQ
jgi:UPF0755 protein